ncbi:MAG: DUF1461 domain-containing protein, partial [Coriobacteriia bacterium]|nr:DUF1461 domain-containing protein [Coriobacteriia bacterium]
MQKSPHKKPLFRRKQKEVQDGFDAVRKAAIESKAEVVNPALRAQQQAHTQEQKGPSPEKLAQMRYRYQGQTGYDVSKVMAPAEQSQAQKKSKEAEGAAAKLGDGLATFVDKGLLDSKDESVLGDADKAHLLHDPLGSFSEKRSWPFYLKIAAMILFSVMLIVTSLGSALAFVAFQPTNAELIAFAHAGYPPEEIEARQTVAAEILRYVTILPFEPVPGIEIGQEDLDTLRQWSLGDYELCHLTDVRIILGRSLLLAYILLPLSAAIIWFNRDRQLVRHSLLIAGIACIVLPLVASAFIYFFFQPTFVLFHEIFFPQGNWQFAPETLLISTLPERYWQASGLLWMAVFMLNGIILTGLSRFCGKMHAWSVTND